MEGAWSARRMRRDRAWARSLLSLKTNQVRPRRQVLRGLQVPHQAEPRERAQHPPAGIGLARLNPEPRRTGERVVIVVPGLAHGDQAAIRDVVALHAGALEMP